MYFSWRPTSNRNCSWPPVTYLTFPLWFTSSTTATTATTANPVEISSFDLLRCDLGIEPRGDVLRRSLEGLHWQVQRTLGRDECIDFNWWMVYLWEVILENIEMMEEFEPPNKKRETWDRRVKRFKEFLRKMALLELKGKKAGKQKNRSLTNYPGIVSWNDAS